MKVILVFIILHFLPSVLIAQKKSSLIEDIFNKQHTIIITKSYLERMWRNELHIIYSNEATLKIHSVIKTPDRILDTVYTLNNLQIMQLDTFANNIKSGVLPKGIVFGGVLVEYEIQFPNGEIVKKKGYVDYSLFDVLIKGPEFHHLQTNRVLEDFKKYKSK